MRANNGDTTIVIPALYKILTVNNRGRTTLQVHAPDRLLPEFESKDSWDSSG